MSNFGLKTVYPLPQNWVASGADKVIDLQGIRSLGVVSRGNIVSGFSLNGNMLAGPVSSAVETGDIFTLEDDEFINYIGIETSYNGFLRKSAMTCFKFRTNLKRSFQSNGCGSTAVTHTAEYYNIRLFGMKATISSAANLGMINSIGFHLIEDYSEPAKVDVAEEALAVIGITTQFSTMETVRSSQVSKVSAATRMMKSQFSQSVSASVTASGEVSAFVAQASFSATVSGSVGSTAASSQQMKQELASTLKETEIFSQQIPEGYVGLELVKVQVVREDNGFEWMFPISAPKFVTISTDAELDMGVYDLTSMLGLQLPAMASRITTRNGATWIPKK